MLRGLLFVGATALIGASFPALGAETFRSTIVIKDHKFEPAELKLPADKWIVLTVDNQDATPEEFEFERAQGREGHPRRLEGRRPFRPVNGRPLSFLRRVQPGNRPGRGGGGIGQMLGAFIIVLREVIEAGLIVGIVLAATRGVAGRGLWVGFGVVGGLIGATVVAFFAGAISDTFEGAGQELFNATILILAVGMLAWHNAWMARHGRELAAEVRQVGKAVALGERPLTALAIVCGIAVLREGSEVVLFLYGIVASGTSGSDLLIGGLLGVLGGGAFTGLTYLGLLAVPTRYIFSVTGVLITFLAAGMASQAVFYLNSAGVLTVLNEQVWDTSWLLSQSSLVGVMLHTLLGYTDRPTEMQLIVYLGTILGMTALARYASAPRRSAIA